MQCISVSNKEKAKISDGYKVFAYILTYRMNHGMKTLDNVEVGKMSIAVACRRSLVLGQ